MEEQSAAAEVRAQISFQTDASRQPTTCHEARDRQLDWRIAPMTARTRIILVGIGAIIVFDVVAAMISRETGTPYAWTTYGSWILYTALGYLAGRTSPGSALLASAIAGVIFGLVDATLGWAVSWGLGPGRIAAGVTAMQWVIVAVVVTVLATGFAALGGSFARMRRGSARR